MQTCTQTDRNSAEADMETVAAVKIVAAATIYTSASVLFLCVPKRHT